MKAFEREVAETAEWFSIPRFDGITRLYSPRQVVEQRGTIRCDYSIAKDASVAFYDILRDLFKSGKSITTFGPYSPGQAVQIKRSGIQAIYLGGWATSARGSKDEDPGSDLASYPLSQVPDEAAMLVRALLAADKNQMFARTRMSPAERQKTPEVDFRPFIIADADTGHGGDAHVRNLIRRFVEVGEQGSRKHNALAALSALSTVALCGRYPAAHTRSWVDANVDVWAPGRQGPRSRR